MSQFPGRKKKARRRCPAIPEPYETFILTELLQRGNVAVDLGANGGHYTIRFARSVFPNGRVYAFEPDPRNFEALTLAIAKSGLPNVIAEQKATSNKNGTAQLYLNSVNLGDHRLYDSGNGWPSVEVETIRLDDYFAKYKGRIDLIKMDIQGSEAWTLAGMSALIERSPGLVIAAEYWPFGLKTAGVNPVSFLRKLKRLGFALSNINEGLKCLEEITDVVAFTAAYPENSPLYTNVLAVSTGPT